MFVPPPVDLFVRPADALAALKGCIRGRTGLARPSLRRADRARRARRLDEL